MSFFWYMRIWQDFVVFVLQFILQIAQIPLFIYTAISMCVQKIMFKLSLAIRVISLSEKLLFCHQLWHSSLAYTCKTTDKLQQHRLLSVKALKLTGSWLRQTMMQRLRSLNLKYKKKINTRTWYFFISGELNFTSISMSQSLSILRLVIDCCFYRGAAVQFLSNCLNISLHIYFKLQFVVSEGVNQGLHW